MERLALPSKQIHSMLATRTYSNQNTYNIQLKTVKTTRRPLNFVEYLQSIP